MDFNQLKDLKSTWGENRTIVPEWVEGQSFYVVSDELLKQLINEINESRLLREQIVQELEVMDTRLPKKYKIIWENLDDQQEDLLRGIIHYFVEEAAAIAGGK